MSQQACPEPDELLKHAAWIRRLASSLTRDPDTADDASQDALITALRAEPGQIRSLRPWLAGVLMNALRQRSRSEARRRQREQSTAREDYVEPTRDLVLRAEMHRRLTDHVLYLPARTRSVILMCFYEELSLTQVADCLSLSRETVSRHKARGLELLRRRLDDDHQGNRNAWVGAFLTLQQDEPVGGGSTNIEGTPATPVSASTMLKLAALL
ncbi:MAG: RNA polymerase sigma factor, partial [Planctomycetota bacterium]